MRTDRDAGHYNTELQTIYNETKIKKYANTAAPRMIR